MNEKQVRVTDKTTGEELTVTMQQAADMANVNRSTIFRNIQTGTYETGNFLISNVATPEPNDADLDSNVATSESNDANVASQMLQTDSNVAPENPNDAKKSSNVAKKRSNVAGKKSNVAQEPKPTRPATEEQQNEYKRTIIPSGPCIYCGENVYHTAIIEGKKQFVCFGKCEPINHDHSRKRTMIPNALKSIVNS